MGGTRAGGQRNRIKENERLVVRIDLVGAKPPIWRRLHIQPDLPLDGVHEAIQIAFDWDDSHLHEFTIGNQGAMGGVKRFAMSHSSDFGGFWDDATPEHSVSIGQLLKNKGDKVQYTYDFGDSWKHSLKLEGIVNVEPDSARVACVAGRRATPPEDFGGIWAYEWTVQVSQDPMHPGYADAMERVEWAGGLGALDPGAFDLAAIQARLERMFGQADR